MKAELIRFLRQFIAVGLDKGSAYIFTIYFYLNEYSDVTDFFVTMSLSSFLGPLLLLGNGAIITRDSAQNKNKELSSVVTPLFILNMALGCLLVPFWFNSKLFLLDVGILSLAFMNFAMLMSFARSFAGWQTSLIGVLKFMSFSFSIIIFGIDKFHLSFYLASIVILFWSLGNRYMDLSSINLGKVKVFSNITLLLHSLSRWLMNSSDKVLLSYCNVSWSDEYTFLYSLASGISIVGNTIANYVPRLVYINEDSKTTKFLVNISLLTIFIVTVIMGYIYLNFNSSFKMISFLLICLALRLNAFTPSITAIYNKSKKYSSLALIGMSTSILCFILFYFTIGLGINIFSLINVVTFGIYLIFLVRNKYEKI